MRKSDVSCVYQILNVVNGRRYIGSTRTFYHRKDQHLYDLRHNRHASKLMQDDYNEFGERRFLFHILETQINIDNLFPREQIWIDKLHPTYNTSPKAQGWDYIREDSKEKISLSVKKLWKNPEYHASHCKPRNWKNGIPNRTGVKLSDETKEKIRQANLGDKNPNYGKPRSQSFVDKVAKTYPGAISPDGIIYAPITNMRRFCIEHDLDDGSMTRLMTGRYKSHRGWVKFMDGGQ